MLILIWLSAYDRCDINVKSRKHIRMFIDMKIDNLTASFKQILSFGVIGTIITLLGLIIYWGCVYYGIYYQFANAVGFCITIAIAYVLNHNYTFKKDKQRKLSLKGLLKAYASYSITGLFLSAFLLWVWTDCLKINENIAPVINLIFTIPVNFVLNKFWVYKAN